MSTFEEKLSIIEGAPDACWLWIWCIDRYGYGVASVNGNQMRAHRAAFEARRGEIPHGLTIDHLCRVRNCVNPVHLEPVSRGENVLRGEGLAATNARKTHCHRGHEFTPENTYAFTNSRGRPARDCRICKKERKRQYNQLCGVKERAAELARIRYRRKGAAHER